MALILTIVGDLVLKLPNIQRLQIHALASNRIRFAYEFTALRDGPIFWYEGPEWLRTGADHEDEILYVLGLPHLLGQR